MLNNNCVRVRVKDADFVRDNMLYSKFSSSGLDFKSLQRHIWEHQFFVVLAFFNDETSNLKGSCNKCNLVGGESRAYEHRLHWDGVIIFLVRRQGTNKRYRVDFQGLYAVKQQLLRDLLYCS